MLLQYHGAARRPNDSALNCRRGLRQTGGALEAMARGAGNRAAIDAHYDVASAWLVRVRHRDVKCSSRATMDEPQRVAPRHTLRRQSQSKLSASATSECSADQHAECSTLTNF